MPARLAVMCSPNPHGSMRLTVASLGVLPESSFPEPVRPQALKRDWRKYG